MRIASITTAVIEANYDWTIVRVESDEGMCGWGEAFCAPGLAQTIRELASLLEGEDARQVEPLVRKLHLATAHVSSGGTVYHAISGIEAALWDLAARSLEVPLWQLFGGGISRARAHLCGLPCRRGTDELQRDPRLQAAAVDGDADGRARRQRAGGALGACGRG